MNAILMVFLGGGLGSVARYLVSLSVKNTEHGFPTKTFIANFLSCIILGFLLGWLTKNHLDDKTKLLLMTGFCGGFSTFSTFSAEVFLLMEQNQFLMAISYVLLSIVLCTIILFCAYYLAHQM
jgi:CrcB protein